MRKCIKWYKKLFFHLLDIAVQNAYALYKLENSVKPQLAEFRLQLIRELYELYGSQRPNFTGRPTTDIPLRLTARHFPSLIPSSAIKKSPQRKCIVCSSSTRRPKVRKDSRYQCTECDVGLCINYCFKDYHTLKHF